MIFPYFIKVINDCEDDRKSKIAECLAYAEIKMSGQPFTIETLTEKLREYYNDGAIFNINEAVLIGNQHIQLLKGVLT